MEISFTHQGDFTKTEKFLERARRKLLNMKLDRYGRLGVEALEAATPKESGKTASSWTYSIDYTAHSVTINWNNTNVHKGINIAVILQYGHGTGTGGYVQGRDYINPALQPLFDKIADDTWKEVIGK